ncbi:DNA gyrase inhibitor YacG [Phaeobacter gallaeciensis]|uniref:DNA gyrase inhibitor YacG n=1 Tax=Phaeobacter gallaeciensis TaxID=60890 RepID=UPI002380017D|nr:DNA gyrase inhibitor YacG [Phaeobacter gallaeciensis]MDE4275046.1 DNA gyrase inhibitor YacG [Phaeobacter gallaeciensis]MDE4300037.1 DNA gyrase inhibitor YacG [Phaeobacter gallaeciensis]MDE5185201.1 DNA gyrase inhibitor YacG [Phaeobacter gallaeciensis]
MSCPMCGEETARAYRPFCSRRCADLDLAKWLNGAYAVPSRDPEDIEKALEETERLLSSGEKPSQFRH